MATASDQREREPAVPRGSARQNYCEWLADKIRPLTAPYPVYSYCNPDREYNGEVLIEFNENEYNVRTLISGAELREYKLVVSCRAPTYELANYLTRRLLSVLEIVLEENGVSFAWDEEGVTADVRGIVEGESFHGYAEFTIHEFFSPCCRADV